ncbi:MAG: flagellar export chaperone FlgN [Thermotogae bacterium]|nr:flagellar export chaperone FlgN [Thermotogota bacterium]
MRRSLKSELQKLLHSMDREVAIMEALAEQLALKMQTLSERAFEEVMNTEHRIEELLSQLQQVEIERDNAVKEVASRLGIFGDVKASDLLVHVSGKNREEMMIRMARMLRAANELQLLRKGLEEMLEFEMAYSTTLMRLLYSRRTLSVYDKNGNDKETEESGRGWSG